METATQNLESLFEKHKNLINSTIRRNRPLLTALRLEDEDVAQQLAVKMLAAIRKFDPDRSESLAAHIRHSLRYEILNIKRRFNPHGITGIPKGYRPDFLYLDDALPGSCAYELPFCDDMSGLEVSELLESFTETEAEAVDLKIQGHPIRRKSHAAALNEAGRRYAELYAVGVR
jgi:hypothetical protein